MGFFKKLGRGLKKGARIVKKGAEKAGRVVIDVPHRGVKGSIDHNFGEGSFNKLQKRLSKAGKVIGYARKGVDFAQNSTIGRAVVDKIPFGSTVVSAVDRGLNVIENADKVGKVLVDPSEENLLNLARSTKIGNDVLGLAEGIHEVKQKFGGGERRTRVRRDY